MEKNLDSLTLSLTHHSSSSIQTLTPRKLKLSTFVMERESRKEFFDIPTGSIGIFYIFLLGYYWDIGIGDQIHRGLKVFLVEHLL